MSKESKSVALAASAAKVLLLAASPITQPRLELDKEARSIREKIRASKHAESIEFKSEWAVRPGDLLQALNEHEPTVLHFTGHGDRKGLVLHDDEYGEKRVSGKALKVLFEAIGGSLTIVVLSSCYSEAQAKMIVDTVGCVVAIKGSIDPDVATTFAASFYGSLGFGHSVKRAFDQGRAAVALQGLPQQERFQLLCKEGLDPESITLIAAHKAKASTTPATHRAAAANSSSRELDIDPPTVLWRLPRGFLLLESLRDTGATWSTRAFHYRYDGSELHGTHYHASYHRSWWERPNGIDVQLRKLRVPKGDAFYAIDALQLLCDLREGNARIDAGARTLDVPVESALVTVVFDKKTPMPVVPSEYIPLQASGELRDFLVEIREFGEGARSIRRKNPGASMGGQAASALRKLRQEARLVIHQSLSEKDHPARQNVEEVIAEFQGIARDPDAADEYEVGSVLTWLDELKNAVAGAVVEVEKRAAAS